MAMTNKGLVRSILQKQYKRGKIMIVSAKSVQPHGSCNITNLPDDCLHIIFNFLKRRHGTNSFGLTCRQWLHIHDYYPESLSIWFSPDGKKDESFPMLLLKVLSRFQNLKILYLIGDIPELKDFIASKPPFLQSKVKTLCLSYCYENSDIELSSMFTCFPRLTFINFSSSHMSDMGLEALVKCCSSLKEVILSDCQKITDSGISFLLQNCRDLFSLKIDFCSKITGIGFLSCPKTLTHLKAGRCKFNTEGIKAIASGGGIEYLYLTAPGDMDRYKGRIDTDGINTESVVAISKGCPLLKKLRLIFCDEVELEAWEAISQNCKNLERLNVYGCTNLCDLGLQALCNGCNKLSKLSIDEETSCSRSALELFERKRPNVIQTYYKCRW